MEFHNKEFAATTGAETYFYVMAFVHELRAKARKVRRIPRYCCNGAEDWASLILDVIYRDDDKHVQKFKKLEDMMPRAISSPDVYLANLAQIVIGFQDFFRTCKEGQTSLKDPWVSAYEDPSMRKATLWARKFVASYL